MFGDYLARWALTPDGDPIVTRNSHLLPVRRQGVSAMLKISVESEEKIGNQVMTWWDGEGSACVLAHSGDAILLERAENTAALAELSRSGRDDEATRIICAVVARLHARRDGLLPDVVPLGRWFAALAPAAEAHGGILTVADATARELLSEPREIVVLHGDIHHENILWFGNRGWLAVDPKGLVGERGFDFANLFCNPDAPTATAPGRFARRMEVVAEAAGLDRTRLLQWNLAWAGLSSAWLLDEGLSAELPLKIGELALAELNQGRP
jgi:streptomycin 6-kinase